jgi:hypothetical protein
MAKSAAIFCNRGLIRGHEDEKYNFVSSFHNATTCCFLTPLRAKNIEGGGGATEAASEIESDKVGEQEAAKFMIELLRGRTKKLSAH